MSYAKTRRQYLLGAFLLFVIGLGLVLLAQSFATVRAWNDAGICFIAASPIIALAPWIRLSRASSLLWLRIFGVLLFIVGLGLFVLQSLQQQNHVIALVLAMVGLALFIVSLRRRA